MTPWQWIKNNIPPYAEEITINQVEETLSNFKQPIPNGFVELEQLNWMCSTQGWKESICERYNCLINGEWKQVDICHTLLEKLELAKNIPYPVYISPDVLEKGLDRYFAYNVENEEEIFLEKSFTIENLEEDISKLFEKIKELEKENKKLKDELAKEKYWWDKWINEENNVGVGLPELERNFFGLNEFETWLEKNRSKDYFLFTDFRGKFKTYKIFSANENYKLTNRWEFGVLKFLNRGLAFDTNFSGFYDKKNRMLIKELFLFYREKRGY